jgi:hypothetical protein
MCQRWVLGCTSLVDQSMVSKSSQDGPQVYNTMYSNYIPLWINIFHVLMLFIKTTVRNNVFCARFYCVLLTTCFGPDRWPSSGNMYIKYTDPLTYTVVTLNSMVWVRERTIPTERPPLVGEVSANVYGARVPRGQRDGSLRPYSRFSIQEPLLFYQVASQLYSQGWVDPVPDPLLYFFSGSAGNRTRASGSVAKNSDH